MPWTYNVALTDDKDKVRLLIGDVLSTDQQLSDEEIVAVIAMVGGSVNTAAIRCCRILAARYARQADKWVGDLKIMASQRSRAYLQLAEDLEEAGSSLTGTRTHQTPFAGGIRVSQKQALEADTDFPPTSFKKGMHDNVSSD